MVVWAKRVGVIFASVILAAALWPFGAAIAMAAIGIYLWDRWRKWRAVRRFRACWTSQGRDLLLVYSNSPHWQRHVEETWLPKWEHRAVVLNWSERSQWGSSARAEVALFRAFAGAREFNPLGIVVPAIGQVHVIRFWRAFRDHKHGKDRLLLAAEADLGRLLGDGGV